MKGRVPRLCKVHIRKMAYDSFNSKRLTFKGRIKIKIVHCHPTVLILIHNNNFGYKGYFHPNYGSDRFFRIFHKNLELKEIKGGWPLMVVEFVRSMTWRITCQPSKNKSHEVDLITAFLSFLIYLKLDPDARIWYFSGSTRYVVSRPCKIKSAVHKL